MHAKNKTRTIALILVSIAAFSALITGIFVGVGIAETINTINEENFSEFQPALPSKILDVEGRLITEFGGEEKREIVTLDELPLHLVYALLTREDQSFYQHSGFTLKSLVRALWGKVSGQTLGGGSTITQQVAGTLYADRSDYSIKRKFVELWWALQLERHLTKDEILELYLNKMYLGAGCYGVEAASKFYFGHSAREITVAEAAVLVIQLSSPAYYNPFDNPNHAKERSWEVLRQMAELGYLSMESAKESYDTYWDNYDYTRVSTTAYYARDDKAPWFSEQVRRTLENNILYGSVDITRDGLVVHTTINLDYQEYADLYMKRGIEIANNEFRANSGMRLKEAERTYIPIVDMMTLAFGMSDFHTSGAKVMSKAMEKYQASVNPTVDAMALMFGLSSLKTASNASYGKLKQDTEKTTVEGALITLDQETGHVVALVGGSKYSASNQLIRATQASLMPGSTFKPLYYSAAVDTRKFTEASMIYDQPVVFYNSDGTPYIPSNYAGKWRGSVLMWKALALSLNIPALKVLDGIGFDAAITRAALLLDITDQNEISRTFPRVYPLGLGVIGVSPLKMARAFSVFANQGREVTPVFVTSIEDRNGRIILEPEKELRIQQKKKGEAIQLISPQNAFIMTDMLSRVLTAGTLTMRTKNGTRFTYEDETGKKYTIPAAAKTGTTQNWADVWTVGFTPYFTTAIWFGFDRPGNSLGVNMTGESIAGVAWADYMFDLHKGLPYKKFVRPQTGLVEASVCSRSGLIPTEKCDEGTIGLLFLEGTQPNRYCDIHQFSSDKDTAGQSAIQKQSSLIDTSTLFQDTGIQLDPMFTNDGNGSSPDPILD